MPCCVPPRSSGLSPAEVIIRDVNPLPAPFTTVATVAAPKINSVAVVVVAAPLFAVLLFPLAPAVTSTALTPWYSRIRTSGDCADRSEEHTSELQSHLNLVC